MKLNFIFFCLLFFSSCKLPNIFDKTPYLRFDDTANRWLSKLHKNDTLKFIGNDGSKFTIVIASKDLEKSTIQDCGTIFSNNCTQYYHYDNLYLVYKRLEDNSDRYDNLRIYMTIDSTMDKKNIPKGTDGIAKIQGKLYGYNSNFDFPYLNFPDLYSTSNFETFTNTQRKYEKVIILKTGNDKIVIDRYFRYERVFNEIGFDIEFGFVYFKDIYGNIWKRIN
jgi:hypothetical protein